MKKELEKVLSNSIINKPFKAVFGEKEKKQTNDTNKKIWLFNAGSIFAGNPKWLYVYIFNYRKDIKPIWICDNEETVNYINGLGYTAYINNCEQAYKYEVKAQVYVVENVKESFPVRLNPKCKILNLFHGVGCKSIEKKVDYGFLNENIARKYIKFNSLYKTRQLFLVTSPLMEKHFKEQCGIDDDMVIRGGYPRCEYQKYFDKIETFDHNIKKSKGLSANAKVAVYAPTYRDADAFDFFGKAFPDMELIRKKLEEKNMLLIFKMHPFMEKDAGYVATKEYYKDCPNFLFWDNSKDFYEIMDQIDLAIIDYSSIYYDLLAAGVKNFVRYIFDYGQKDTIRDLVFDLIEMTSGKICKSFDELVNSFDYKNTIEDEQDTKRIEKLFWEYSSKDTFEHIIEETEKFKIKQNTLRSLYSFDIFDTLISRKCLEPIGIFYKVQQKMKASKEDFPSILISNYPNIRRETEANLREYYFKTLYNREDERNEITFDEIFDKIQYVYTITDEQKKMLAQWELDAEYEDSIPIQEKIGLVEKYLDQGETVILVSDMYLPKEFIKKLLAKANPRLAELPIFLSCEYGVMKTTRKLYMAVYNSFSEYLFGEWRHFGDNVISDGARAKQLGIKVTRHVKPSFNDYETALVKTIGTYDAFLVAAKLARFRDEDCNEKDYYAYAYVSLYLVPYISATVKDALKKGIKTLYFISRDGFHLKRIADAIIKKKGLDIKTKYIYGSRKAWRVPSFISEIDKEFFTNFGNFALVSTYKKLVKSSCLTQKQFDTVFPELAYLKKQDTIDVKTMKDIRIIMSNSVKYKEYLLEYAKESRKIIEDYFKQEINFDEKFAFVEYWGRGYTQDCHQRLMQNTIGKELDVPYYYMRSVYPSEGHSIRYNFTSNNQKLMFVEALFANLPYKSVSKYKYEENKVVPIITPIDCDFELHEAMCNELTAFCFDFYHDEYEDEDTLESQLFEFSFAYYEQNQKNDMIFTNCLSKLIYSEGQYGENREFAPAFTMEDLSDLEEKRKTLGMITSSLPITEIRSDANCLEEFERITVTSKLEAKAEKKLEKEKNNIDLYEIESNKLLKQFKKLAKKYNAIYNVFAQNPIVKSSVLFIAPMAIGDLKPEYYSLYKELKKREVTMNFLQRTQNFTEKDLSMLASSEYVFIINNFELISMLSLREETKVINLNAYKFPFNRFGQLREFDKIGESTAKLINATENASYSFIPAASENIKDVLVKAFPNTNNENINAVGCSCTDIYFDEEYKNKCFKKLYKLMPSAKGKKIICYIPKQRFRQEPYRRHEFLDIDRMYQYLKDEYIILYHTKAKIQNTYNVPTDLKDFARNINGEMFLRELFIVSDIIVGDYRDSFFETPILNKPIFSTAWDLKNYINQNTPYFDYEKDVCGGPIVANTMDLISQIINIDNYDYSIQQKVKEKYFNMCDGNSTKRMLDIILK